MEGKAPRGDGIDHQEEHKAHNQHPQQLQIMKAQEAHSPNVIVSTFVFHHQTEAAEEEEYRHAVMAEIREQMHGQQFVGVRQHLPQTGVVLLQILILVLLHNASDEVAVVVQHDGQDGDTPHRRTLSPRQYLFHFFSIL